MVDSSHVAEHIDVVIAGSGAVGLLAAASISAADPTLSLLIVDPSFPQQPTDDLCGLRVSALTPASIAMLSDVGVWSSMPKTHWQAFSSMRVWDAGVSCGEGVFFDAAALGVGQLGVITDNAMLRWNLWSQVAANPAIQVVSASVDSADARASGVAVKLDSGQHVSTRLLVGADGRNSSVRKLAGMPVTGWSHDQSAVVAHLKPDVDHERCALQRFLPNGPLALLPLPGGLVSLVWSTTHQHAAELKSMPENAFAEAVSKASDYVLGELTPVTSTAAFPLVSQYANDPVGCRTVLIGDASHAIHPLAGQGANLGFSDVAVLAAIARDARQADLGDAPWLRRYRRRRKADNLATLYGLDLINRLFARDAGIVADLRRRGMQVFERSGLIKRLAGGHAMGRALGVLPARDGAS
ncbi:MAG: FAD-dependent monooxygenase [Woeseiaceae bacterium]